VFVGAGHWPRFWATWMKSITTPIVPLRPILALSSHPRLGLQSCLFTSGFETKLSCAFLIRAYLLALPLISCGDKYLQVLNLINLSISLLFLAFYVAPIFHWFKSITVAARSKAWTVFANSNTWIVGSNPTLGVDVCMRLFCVCVALCVGSGLATGWSPVQGVLPAL
jgi:hypothetical protein